MGLSKELAVSSLRFSLGRFTEKGDIDRVVEVLPGIVGRIREVGSMETPVAYQAPGVREIPS
jgi:cysteine sulfinate desulfinase/cysteine desulfurase-like protein